MKKLLLTALIAAMLVTPASAITVSQHYTYTVQPGDTLTQLAQHTGKDIRIIMANNKLKSDKLVPGQHLIMSVNAMSLSRPAEMLVVPYAASRTVYGTTARAYQTAASSVYPRGTKLFVPGAGLFIVDDLPDYGEDTATDLLKLCVPVQDYARFNRVMQVFVVKGVSW